MDVEDCFRINKSCSVKKIFGTNDLKHPGVSYFYNMGDVTDGGPVILKHRFLFEFSEHEPTPAETKTLFAKNGWRTIVGFQTRNVPYRAHEYLQRTALEQVNGLFIHPLIGRRKKGDFNPKAILKSYQTLVERFYLKQRVVFGLLSTPMW